MTTRAVKTPEWQRITLPKTNSGRGLLIASWTLAADSTLRPGVPPGQLSDDELTSFWADEQNIIDPLPERLRGLIRHNHVFRAATTQRAHAGLSIANPIARLVPEQYEIHNLRLRARKHTDVRSANRTSQILSLAVGQQISRACTRGPIMQSDCYHHRYSSIQDTCIDARPVCWQGAP
jgi:hypothetical protein